MIKFILSAEKAFRAFTTFIQRVLIAFASMASILLGLYLAYSNNVGSAVACFTTGIVLFLFSNLDLFESIKAPGIEATMRKIDAKVEIVQELAEKVASTSATTAEFCMEIMVRVGRLSGPIPRNQAQQLVEKMSVQLRTLNVSASTIDLILAPWNEIVAKDLIRPAYVQLQRSLTVIGQTVSESLRKVRSPINSDDPDYLVYSASQDEVSRFNRMLSGFHDLPAADQLVTITRFHNEFLQLYSEEAIYDGTTVAQAITEAQYFLREGKFLNVQFWLESDPMKIRDPLHDSLY